MKKIKTERKSVRVDKLTFDLQNPRFGLKKAETEDDALNLLFERAKLNELWNSVVSQGWLELEPIVCIKLETEDNDKDVRYVVLEGNRRLAAIKTLLDPSRLEQRYQSRVPVISDDLRSDLEAIEIVVVDDRHDADAFIGFKHVNGPASWGSLAKAKFASEMFEGLVSRGTAPVSALEQVTKTLGDTTPSSMLRMLVGFEVLEQAVKEKFVTTDEVEAKAFDFSHLYTMMPNPATRAFLGWGKEPLTVDRVCPNPVGLGHIDNLRLLIGWLFGTDGVPQVIKAQGADRPKLQKVLAHRSATETLIETGNFDLASSKAGLDVESWRSRLMKAEDQAKSILEDLSIIQARLEDEYVEDAIDRSGSLKSTYNTILSSLKSFNED